jgi:hypothetical protein
MVKASPCRVREILSQTTTNLQSQGDSILNNNKEKQKQRGWRCDSSKVLA